jgi:hypothetical protein
MPEKRSDTRTAFRASVKMTHNNLGEHILRTRDMSHSGAYLILRDDIGLSQGDIVSIQSIDIDDAPIIDSEIVRIESDGFAIRYIID